MNQHLHRLVFSRRHGMWVAVAETAPSSVKAGGKGPSKLRAAAVASALIAVIGNSGAQTRPPVVFASRLPAPTAATSLPVPYGSAGGANTSVFRPFVYDPARGANSADLAASGRVSWTVNGKNATFDQGSVERVVINWDSFNIGSGYTVHFAQDKDPAKYVSALNRIWSADPSVILGSLTADREVILLNSNGVYFGRGARVDTGKFVATSLSIADSVFDKGLRNVTDGSAVFSSAGTDYRATDLNSGVTVEAGAEIRSAAGGDVLLIAPRVVNQGRIETPSGQAVLAAGDKVYLMSSSDPAQRGLIVAVDPVLTNGRPDAELGIVENSATGTTPVDTTTGLVNTINEIRADSGTVNLVGLTVRQKGDINATTAVKGANGAIYLQAMASTAVLPQGAATTVGSAGARGLTIEAGGQVRVGADLGTVALGAGSVTAVKPSTSTATQIDAEVFNPSVVRIEGQSISMESGASIAAPGGRITMLAAANSIANPLFDATLPQAINTGDGSRIVIAPGASISAAGLANVEVDGARNQGSQRLFRIELADAPVQRDGPLYRSQVYFDLRDGGKITAADLSGATASIARTAAEHSTSGGSVRIESGGAVVLGQDAGIDVSGGSTHTSATVLQNTLTLRGGQVIAFNALGAGTAIDSLAALTQSVQTPAYTTGQAGGSLLLSGNQLAVSGAALKGQVTQGERQRDGTDARAAEATLQIGRASAALNALASLQLTPGAAAPVDAGFFADPLNASLGTLPATTTLSLAQLAGSGFGNVLLRAGNIYQAGFGKLDLGVGGVLDLMAGDTLSLDGGFTAAGGRIALQSIGDLTLSSRTVLDVAGLWTNDTTLAGSSASAAAPVQTGGGSVSVASTLGSLTVNSGAAIDVSAGAWLNGSGTLKTGSAGSIALSGQRVAPSQGGTSSLAGVALSAYDFGSGGTLTLNVQDLVLGPDASLASAQHGGSFTLGNDLFSSHGFGSITVNTHGDLFADNGDVKVLAGTQLSPVLSNWFLAGSYRSAASGRMRAAVATAQPLDTQLVDRKPVNLTINAGRALDVYGGSDLTVERGAAITLEPGAALALSATRSLSVGTSTDKSGGLAGQTADLTARGGNITLAVNGVRGDDNGGTRDTTGFLPDQALWLGDGARLSVAGAAVLRPAGATLVDGSGAAGSGTALNGRTTGSVLGGGNITLNAQRGYVVTERGAVLQLDGASAQLNFAGVNDAVTVAKAAGSLTVSSPEGLALDAQVSARAPVDASGRTLADGGRLSLNLGLGGTQVGTTGNPYDSSRPRQLAVGDYDGWLAGHGAVFGQSLANVLVNGTGLVRGSLLTDAGFAKLALGAGDAIRFDESLTLSMPLGVQLNAPSIVASPGVQVQLNTGYAQLGDAVDGRTGAAVPDRGAVTGDAILQVVAPTIDLLGSFGLKGFGKVQLDAGQVANGEIRLSAVSPLEPTATLAFAGTLGLTAGQVYATSGTLATMQGLAATTASEAGSVFTVRTGAFGAAGAPPLSAFGSLTVQATDIDQGGVLRQPFGSITLAAQRTLTLGDGSITSVSGQGTTVNFGTTDNLSTWVLPTGLAASSLPLAKGISLSGASILTSATATVDASGGGVVQAWEFFPGVGGSTDYFDTAGLYAVIPAYTGTQAVSENGGVLGAAVQGKEIVITLPGSGLAPGRYTLLPARQALVAGSLPAGAFLVSRAADQGKTVLKEALHQDDGSSIVTGFVTDAGSINTGVPGERFVVEPAATYLAKSEIRLSDISTLLAGNAQTLGATTTPLLPRDAGQVQVQVNGNGTGPGTRWQAQVDLRAHGGLAGLLDMSATQLALVDDLAKTPDGTLGISASVLANSGAGSVLLGGRRTQGADGTWTVDQSATTAVGVDLGTQALTLEELLLAATSRVTLATGTHLSAGSVATLGARTLTSVGDGALLAVSANDLTLQRSGAAFAGGNLMLGAGSVLSGEQLLLDATRALQLDGSASLQAQRLDLGAGRLVLGNAAPSATADALPDSVLQGSLLAAITHTADLGLHGYDSITFAGTQDWAARSGEGAATHVLDSLTLDSPLVRGATAGDGAVARTDIAAQSITLRNSTGLASTSSVGVGTLQLQALPPLQYGSTGGMTLGPGALALGFDATTLRSTGDIVLQGSGGLQARNDLTLRAARVTAATGADQKLTATGQLSLGTEAGARTLDELVGQGAAVQLSGATVQQNGVIELAGGNLSLQSTGTAGDGTGVHFGGGSLTSVAGFTRPGPDGFDAYGNAGTLNVTAALGGIAVDGTLDASAAAFGNAGTLKLTAAGSGGQLLLANASLLGRAGTGGTGGRLAVDVATMASADTLADRSTAGGFTNEFNLRVRNGDVALNRDVTAGRIVLSADTGTLALDNTTLHAATEAGGVVQLSAGNNLKLGDNARIDARSTRAGANGGDVLLASSNGRVQLAAGAAVDATGDDSQDGRIVLRALRGANNTVLIDPLYTSQLKAAEVDIEAVRRYTGVSTIASGTTSGSGTNIRLGMTTVANDNTAFMTGKANLLTSLGATAADSGRVNLRAGVEVQSTGDLTLASDWALNTDRAGGDAGFLTLRAAGNLVLTAGSISDGFSTTTTTGVLNDNLRSWSIRMAAGADLTAANPLAVRDLSASTANTGNITIGAGRFVRTGAGSIEMAAGRDINFAAGSGSTAQGLAYVAGRKLAGQADVLASLFGSQSAKPTFTEQGGRLELAAARNITSAESTQLINNWLWRSGIPSGDTYAAGSQLAWWTEFSRFRETLGSFGGGNVVLRAGGDIVNVQAVVPTQAWADSRQTAAAQLQVRNGGDLTVTAGHDILGGQYLLGRGAGTLQAGGSIGAATSNVRAQNPLLALLDGQWSVSSRSDLTVGSAFDPTAMLVSSADNRSVVSSFFYSWGGDAGLKLNSAAGDVRLFNELATGSALQAYGLGISVTLPQFLSQVLPPTLQATAASGDVSLFGSGLANALLFPSATADFSVWAGGDALLNSRLVMSDSLPSLWPAFSHPVTTATFSSLLIGPSGNGLVPGTINDTLTHSGLHAADAAPARLHAERDIRAVETSGFSTLVLPKEAQITAGRDIVGLQFSGQNLDAADTTVITAGRNLLAGNFGSISLAGPGALEVTAGRQVDLANSAGITTTGNVRNSSLPSQGASVRLAAASDGALDLAALDTQYLEAGGSPRAQAYRDMLLAQVRSALRDDTLTYDQAWALFKTFPAAAQAAFGRQVLAAEFGAVYLAGTVPTTAQMTETLRAAFEQHKVEVLQAGDAALASGGSLTLPGREVLQGAALASYLADLRALSPTNLDVTAAVAARVASLTAVHDGWREAVATSLGSSAAALDALVQRSPQDPAALAWTAALQTYSGAAFDAYRQQVMKTEVSSAGATASLFGLKSLPMREALFDQGFQAAELTGAGSFVAQGYWQGPAPLFAYTGSLEMTQSSVVTERGGAIDLINAGGAINVGLKQDTSGAASAAKGVIALGGGDIFGLAKGDFQVNTQRVFIVGQGDMNLWSSVGDIDSGRGANTAVAAPPLVARRSVDGVVFETPATTTGSGLGILEDANGRLGGSIGLFPALGEVRALDAFIRAPSVVLGATIRGADNLQSGSVAGAAAPVAAPPVSTAPPTSNEARTVEEKTSVGSNDQRQRNALLTVELQGLGPDDTCSEQDRRDNRCKPAPPRCSTQGGAGDACR